MLGYTPVNKAGDTMTGDLVINDTANGRLALLRGSAALPGFVGFYTPEGTRRGYIGWGDGTNNTLTGENGWGWSVIGAFKTSTTAQFNGVVTAAGGSIEVKRATLASSITMFDGVGTNGFQIGQGFISDTDRAGYLFNRGNGPIYFGTNNALVGNIDTSANLTMNGGITVGGGRKLSKITLSTAAPGALADGELYLRY